MGEGGSYDAAELEDEGIAGVLVVEGGEREGVRLVSLVRVHSGVEGMGGFRDVSGGVERRAEREAGRIGPEQVTSNDATPKPYLPRHLESLGEASGEWSWTCWCRNNLTNGPQRERFAYVIIRYSAPDRSSKKKAINLSLYQSHHGH